MHVLQWLVVFAMVFPIGIGLANQASKTPYFQNARPDPVKPYPIRLAVFSAAQQYEDAHSNKGMYKRGTKENEYEGGYYTKKLLDGLPKADSFAQAHKRFTDTISPAARLFTNGHKKAQAAVDASNLESTHKGLDAMRDDYNDINSKELKDVVTARKKATAEGDTARVAELNKREKELYAEHRKAYAEFRRIMEPLPGKIEALRKPFQEDITKGYEGLKTPNGVRQSLPVTSENTDITGWKKTDKNPRTALLIEGKDLPGTGKDIEAMKQTLMKDFGLKESDIHVARTPEQVRTAMAAMNEFGEKHAKNSPAAMLYYSGHGFVDNLNLSYKGQPKDIKELEKSGKPGWMWPESSDSQGSARGTFKLASDSDPKQDAYFHEYELIDEMAKNFKNFDGRAQMFLDTCNGGAWTAQQDTQTPKSSEIPKESDTAKIALAPTSEKQEPEKKQDET